MQRLSALRRSTETLLSVLQPPLCPLCEAPLRSPRAAPKKHCVSTWGLCGNCFLELDLWAADRPRSPLLLKPDLELRHPFYYDGAGRDLILGAKWHGRRSYEVVLANALLEALCRDDWDQQFDVWCPVPRDLWRTIRKGTPLCEHLGRRLTTATHLKRLAPPKRRRRPPQAALTGARRRKNLRHVFQTGNRLRRQCRGRRVLIIDDVATTGATLNELANTISSAGASDVGALVIAVRSLEGS